MKPLILASQSPRRKEILEFFSIPFIQVSPPFDEASIALSDRPKSYAKELAQKKADSLKDRFPTDIILAADTIVVCDEKIYNKPSSEKAAYEMLCELSGNWHFVYTAVSVRLGDFSLSAVEETKILLHSLTEEQIRQYHKIFYYHDKAGGYAIQRGGSIIVKKIEGCFYNIMGLPINTTRELLQKLGIDLWKFLKPL